MILVETLHCCGDLALQGLYRKPIICLYIFMRKILLFVLTICIYQLGQAQELTYGFKTGLTISKINGSSEQSSGRDLESNATTGGFMVGAIFRYNITELVGLKGELLYNQKGTKYNYSGLGYQILPSQAGTRINITGAQRIDLDISNSYLNLPIMVYGKVGKFELEGGVSIGLLLSSTGTGELEIDGITAAGASTGVYTAFLDYRYKKDEPGGVVSIVAEDLATLNIDGQLINIPKILGAYYAFTEDRGDYFNTLDIGLVGGINYYWNSTLYLGGRVNYGLSDVTDNNGYDVARMNLDSAGNFITNADKDRNLSIQISLGFSF